MDSIHTSVIKYLNNHYESYEIIEHLNPIHSAKQGAQYFNIEIGQTAPTLIVKADDNFYGVIFSGKRNNINFNKLSGYLGCKTIRMATKKEVEQELGYLIGAVPMVGLSVNCVIDKTLFNYQHIFGGTGSPNHTLKISPLTLRRVNKIILETEDL